MDMTTVAETPVAREIGIGDGIVNVSKPAGWTSHDVVVKIRICFSAEDRPRGRARFGFERMQVLFLEH